MDSPAGLAAWMVEKWREWSDCAGDSCADLRRWTPLPAGGHFAAMEEPDPLAGDLDAFFQNVGP
jgi:hypothetical protein